MLLGRLSIGAFLYIAVSGQQCYNPDGSLDDSWPCSSDPSNPLADVCCLTGREVPSGGNATLTPTRDECLPNGLCLNRGFDNARPEGWNHFYRVGCANKDWSGCLDVCLIGATNNPSQLTPCDNTSTSERWCCGDTTECCSEGSKEKAVIIPRSLGVFLSSASAAATASSSGAVLEPSKSPAPDNPNGSRGRNIGLGVGVGVGALLLLLAGFWLFLRHKKRARSPLRGGNAHGEPMYQRSEMTSSLTNLPELHGTPRYSELPGSKVRRG
ncbi:hypothetical protein ACN47E_006553 [Coniothyrium glycines]